MQVEAPRENLHRSPQRQQQLQNDGSVLTILFAGHDLKFADDLMNHMMAQGHTVVVDKWHDHNKHEEENSKELLSKADVVFCEWGLGNAVWYSKNISQKQRLVVRVHSQELRRDYLTQIRHENVDEYIFVGELVRQAAIVSHGVPAEKSSVVPNAVDTELLDHSKTADARFNLGMVGIVPQTKRLDFALDILEEARRHDGRFRLFIKGKEPQDYSWLMKIPAELEYYTRQYDRIEKLNSEAPGVVVFDPYDDDMAAWYKKIGSVISVSDFESFHLTLADGAASGSQPYSLLWPGADLIYPQRWLYASTDEIANDLVETAIDGSASSRAAFISTNFAYERVLQNLNYSSCHEPESAPVFADMRIQPTARRGFRAAKDMSFMTQGNNFIDPSVTALGKLHVLTQTK